MAFLGQSFGLLRQHSAVQLTLEHDSLGLRSSSKRWCEWLLGVVLGPGTLEKGEYGLRRPGWQFRVRV